MRKTKKVSNQEIYAGWPIGRNRPSKNRATQKDVKMWPSKKDFAVGGFNKSKITILTSGRSFGKSWTVEFLMAKIWATQKDV